MSRENLRPWFCCFGCRFAHQLTATAGGEASTSGTLLLRLFYGSYGVSRLIATAVDGRPSASLVSAAATDLVFGALCAVTLMSFEANPGVVLSRSSVPGQ